MKKIFTLLFGIVLSITILNSQVAPPQAFSFKATIQGANGQTVVDKIIRLRISILQDDMNGFPVYSEFFTPTTDHYSQVNVEIGKGNVLSGIFASIDWSAHKYFLKIEVDAKGGTNYQLLSVTQLLSVPYALYAGKAGSAVIESDPLFSLHPAHGISSGNINNWNTAFGWGNHALAGYLTTELDGSITNEIQLLSIDGNVISLSKGGGSVTLPLISTSGGQYYFLDKDGDAYGDNYSPVWVPTGVTPPANFVVESNDCNDNSSNIHPGATEICGDVIDQDCNGTDLECGNLNIDGDGDGYSPNQGDCDDHNATMYPGANEICGDDIDNDCDGQTDEDCILDADGDGYTIWAGDCDDNNATIHPGAVEIPGDGIDQDCNGLIDDVGLVKINEVDCSTPVGNANEFVELYNGSEYQVDLTGWKLEILGASGNLSSTYNLTGQISAKSFLVINFSNTIGNISGAIVLKNKNGTIVDAFAHGSYSGTIGFEGMPSTLADNNGSYSIGRFPNGIDTNNNNEDFRQLAVPTPGSANN